MAMYLSPKKIPTYNIMLQGRWSSSTSLRYIRKQVQEFSIGVSKAMMCREVYAFVTVPDCLDKPHDEDPIIPNNPCSVTSSFNGNNAASIHTRNHIFKWIGIRPKGRLIVINCMAWGAAGLRSYYFLSFRGTGIGMEMGRKI